MKKKFVSIISLLACLALVTGCGEEESSVPAADSSANNYGDVSNNTSEGGDSTSEIIVSDAAIDKDIASFLDGINVTIPSLANYNLEYKVIYYLAYEEYIFTATGTGLGADIEHEYAALFTADTGLTSLNDEDYPVEDYGYLFNDSLQSILVNFFTENGTFNFTIERYDGNAGTLDVSNVDKSWYVDYLNFYGLELFDSFPSSSILSELVIEEELAIPSITADKYVGGFEPSYVDDYGRTVPDTFYIVLEGDQMLDYGVILEGAGYTVEINETTEEVLDLETFDYVEVTSTTIVAYDANKVIYIDISLDASENTIVAFNYFGDVFTSEKTTNTDWTDEEKALMNETLHQLLPFMAFGEDYVIYDASDEDWTLFVIQDTYFEDLSSDYINILLGLGYTIDDVTYEDTYYCLDNGYVYIEIYVGYEGGNYLEVYYEASHKIDAGETPEGDFAHTLTGGFFCIEVGNSSYDTYKKGVDGVVYEAQASAGNKADKGKGLQIRSGTSKNSDVHSGVIAHSEDRTCKYITFTFDSETGGSGSARYIEIYASNTSFSINEMYGDKVSKVGTITFDSNNLTQTYTFTTEYAYVGFRSGDGAVYLKNVVMGW